MAQHSADAEKVKATRVAERKADAEAASGRSCSGSSGDEADSATSEGDDDIDEKVQKYFGAVFRVDDHNTKRFEKACDDYKAAAVKVAGFLRTACTTADGIVKSLEENRH